MSAPDNARPRLWGAVRRLTARIVTGSLVLAGAGVGVVAMSGEAFAWSVQSYSVSGSCNSDGTATVHVGVSSGTNDNADWYADYGSAPTSSAAMASSNKLHGQLTSANGWHSSGTFDVPAADASAASIDVYVGVVWQGDNTPVPVHKTTVNLGCQLPVIVAGTAIAHDTTCAYGGNTGDTWSYSPAEHVTYTVTVNGQSVSGNSGTAQAGDHVVIVAHADSGYQFGGGATTATILDHTFSDNGACKTIQPGTATATDTTCVGGADTGDTWSYTPAEHVTYTVTVNGHAVSGTSGTAQAGDHVVIVAKAASGYLFDNGTRTATILDHTFSDSGVCQVTAPGTAAATDTTCVGGADTGDTWSYTPAAHVTYTVTVNGHAVSGTSGTAQAGDHVVIVAKADTGYTFGNGSDTETILDHTFTDSGACVVVTPVAPTVSQASCDGTTVVGPTYTIPATTGVDYFVAGANTPAAAGSYPATLGSTVVVTAAPQQGYALAAGSPTTFTLTFDDLQCVTPAAPTVAQAECTGPGTSTDAFLTIPTTAGVVYEINGQLTAAGSIVEQPGTYTVTAVPGPHVTLVGQTEWQLIVDTAPDCSVTVQPAAPTLTNAICVNETLVPASYTIPTTTGVDYSVGGQIVAAGTYPADAGSTVVVTAAPRSGYVFAADTTHQWELTFGKAPTCVLGHKIVKHHRAPHTQPQVLPFTGAPTGVLVLLALAALTAGAALTVSGRRRTLPGTPQH